jgi:ZIP family zinc transporter
MPDVVGVAIAGTLTALATGVGAIPVFLLGARADALRPVLWGFAAGVMAVASCAGLIAPALDEAATARSPAESSPGLRSWRSAGC